MQTAAVNASSQPRQSRACHGRAFASFMCDRMQTLIVCVLLGAVAAAIYGYGFLQSYTATTKIIVKPNELYSKAGGQSVQASVYGDIIASPSMVEKVIVEEVLFRNPEFKGISGTQDFYQLDKGKRQTIIRDVSSRLKVKLYKESEIIEVSFRADDPDLAASVANAFVDVFAETEILKAREETKAALKWMTHRVDDLAENIRRITETKVTEKQAENPYNDEIIKLEQYLESAKMSLQDTESVLSGINHILYESDAPLTVPTFMTVPLFESYREEEAELLQKQADILGEKGADSQEFSDVEKELATYRERLEKDIIVYANSLEVKKDIEESEIKSLQKRIAELKQIAGQARPNSEISSSEMVLKQAVQDYIEALRQVNANSIPVKILVNATPPSDKDHERLILIIMGGAAIGLGVSVLWLLLVWVIRRGVSHPCQLEGDFGLPVYAVLPKINMGKDEKPSTYLNQRPASLLAETMRTLLSTLQIRGGLQRKYGGFVVTVTSTHMDEGKTTTSVWLATTAAQNGKKVLVIDADMRRPSLHKAYGIGNARGLADYLSDRLPLDDTIYTKHSSGVDIMTSKAIPVHALMLLSCGRMEELLRRLKESYDLIIIDAPTSLVFSDARILGNLSNKLLYIVQWQRTSLKDLYESMRGFLNSGAADIAFIVTKVNSKKLARYSRQEMAYLKYFNRVKS